MAEKAYNTVLEWSANGTSGWTNVARIRSLKPPKITAKDIDITCLDSPDEFEEFLAGLGNGGELEMTVEYNTTATATLYTKFRVTQHYRIVYVSASGWQFEGFINEIGDDEVVNGQTVTNTIKVKVTGKPEKVDDFEA